MAVNVAKKYILLLIYMYAVITMSTGPPALDQ